MRLILYSGAILLFLFLYQCSNNTNHNHYLSFSRYTDPQNLSAMLKNLPDDVTEICEIAKKQTIHHNLLPYYEVPRSKWKEMARVWPPKMSEMLKLLAETQPNNLFTDRKPEQRIIGGCIPESHFLAGMLRSKNIPVRIRAGYFKNIRANSDHVVAFWEKTIREKQADNPNVQSDYESWRKNLNEYSTWKNKIDHHIEHWACEYWNEKESQWQLLDANNTFLFAHSNIKIGYHLPNKYFEYAFEAWKNMRVNQTFNPDQYSEEPKDGRSHIRTQLLYDFFSLLNHDIAGEGSLKDDLRFIKEVKFEEISNDELKELDFIADLLSSNPSKEQLVACYKNSNTIKLKGAEQDIYSFVFSN